MVSPAGCTMNFVFTDETSKFIGTAGHCVAGGQSVIAQIATRSDPTDSVIVTLASIGSVVGERTLAPGPVCSGMSHEGMLLDHTVSL